MAAYVGIAGAGVPSPPVWVMEPSNAARNAVCSRAIFSPHDIVLVDEINRATSKVQSALLEAMQDRLNVHWFR